MIFVGADPRPRPVGVTEPEVTAMRAAAVARVVIGVVVGVVGLAGGRRWDRSLTVLFLVVGLVWLPWSLFLFLAGSGRTFPEGTAESTGLSLRSVPSARTDRRGVIPLPLPDRARP